MTNRSRWVDRRSRKTGLKALTALALAGALVLSACAPFLALQEQLGASPPPPPTVVGTDFSAQTLNWVSCGSMQCATAHAPLDWAHPEGDRIDLALVKQPALSGEPIGTLFVNPGGPGSSGASFIANSIDYAVGEQLQQHFDVIGWDPRGVGASTAVACLDDAAMDDYLFGESELDHLEPGTQAWVDAALVEVASYGAACLRSTGPLLGHVDTESTVRDLDMMREIVGDEKLNYLGYSYGTYIGARYADMFPAQAGKLVLDGAIDPTSSQAEVVREQTRGFELALRAYVSDCLTRSECPFVGSVDDAMAQWRAVLDAVEARPLVGSDGRVVSSGTLLTAIITPLYSQDYWPYLDQLYATASEGDAELALALADSYYDRIDGRYQTNLITAFAAINCLDYPRSLPLDLEQMRAEAAELEQIAPTIGAFQGYGGVSCATWPVPAVADRQPATAPGADPILVIGTTGDPATPLRWSEALAEQLESGVLLVFEGEGHTAYGGESACVNDIVEGYLLGSDLPASGTRCS